MRYSLRTLLIAMLVVPPVLSWLVGMGSVDTRWNLDRQYARAVHSQLSLLETAVNAYMDDVGSLPPDLDALLVCPPDVLQPDLWLGAYLQKPWLPLDPWGSPYQYEVLDGSDPQFRLWSMGPDRLNRTADDIAQHEGPTS
jgi:general secretion pathway protein G